MEEFRKYNQEENRILLNDNYLFAYTKFDGFSHRLLRAEFVVDWAYNYKLELHAFQHHKITTNKSDTLLEEGVLENDELERFENFLSINFSTIKQNYNFENFDVTDIGEQQFLINFESTTKQVDIINQLPIEYFKEKSEKILFEYNEYLKEMIERKYNIWINNTNI